MKLKSILKDLEKSQRQNPHGEVVVMVYNPSADLDVKFKYNPLPVVDVHVEHADSEINLMIESSDSGKSRVLSVQELSARLKALPRKCGKYNLCTGFNVPEKIDDYSIRLDIPIIGLVTHETNATFGFLQWFSGFEEELGMI